MVNVWQYTHDGCRNIVHTDLRLATNIEWRTIYSGPNISGASVSQALRCVLAINISQISCENISSMWGACALSYNVYKFPCWFVPECLHSCCKKNTGDDPVHSRLVHESVPVWQVCLSYDCIAVSHHDLRPAPMAEWSKA